MLLEKAALKKFFWVFLKCILFFAGCIICVSVIPLPETNNPATLRFWAEVTPLAGVAVMTFIFWLVERRSMDLCLIKRPVFSTCLGIIAGLVWLGLTVVLLMALGVLSFDHVNTIPFLGLWVVSSLLNTAMQELLLRGYLYQVIKKNYNWVWAAVITTVLFTFMHVSAFESGIFPVLNIFTISLIITGMLEYTGSLLAPIVFHFVWNTIGGIILNCLSLADDYPHLLNAAFTGSPILTGGIYKIEGSAVLFVLNILLIVLCLFLKRKRAPRA